MSAGPLEIAAAAAPGAVVAAPFVGALAAALCPGPRRAAAVALLTLGIMGAAAGLVIALHQEAADVSLGPLAIRVDAWSGLFLGLVALGGAVAVAAGLKGLRRAAAPRPGALALALLLAGVGGWAVALLSRDLLAIIAGVQLAALAAAGWTALAGDPRPAALTAALRLTLSAATAGALMMFGAALILARHGVADLAALEALGTGGADRATAAGLVLCAFGALMGAALAPLSYWAPSVLGRGPVFGAVALLAAGAPAAAAIAVRILGALADLGEGAAAGAALIVIGAMSALVGSVQALAARDVRRLAGYAFAAQTGAALVAAALGSPSGASAAALQMIAAAAGTALILAAAPTWASMDAVNGLARRRPVAAAAATLGALIGMGAPLTLGFASHWSMLEAMLARGWWGGAVLVTAVVLAAVVYGGRLIERMHFRPPGPDTETGPDRLRGAGLILMIACVGFLGLAAVWVATVADRAGSDLAGPTLLPSPAAAAVEGEP